MTRPVRGVEAIDPDVDLHVPGQRTEPQGRVLAAVAAGGAVGASSRYGLALLWPAGPGAFPWATFWTNVVGCALIGVLMVLISEGGRTPPHPLVRPFLGVGVLGGFTTFSTYAVEVSRLLDEGAAGTALGYAALTVVAALGAVWAAASVTRLAVRGRG
ncbi:MULTISPECIES: FluC/FEX family fluoride channel [unclassified Streptomyces]|uniref:FluC/FEX family fluoride channel n=1 Tax=unclassified Streptomyces TaxID=2593676 RepID=UPI002E370B69|nr:MULTISPECIES: CrcB family protein [unclassified Streptomyces]WUC65439.1 CrcB family protein [Streptomyces sp. NBC_00539]